MITKFKIYESYEYDEKKNLEFRTFSYLREIKEHILHMIEKYGVDIFEYEKDEFFKYHLLFSYTKAEWIIEDIGRDLFSRFIKSDSDEGIGLSMTLDKGSVYLRKPREIKSRYGRIETRFLSEREYDYAYFYPSPFHYSNVKEVKKLINDMIDKIEMIKNTKKYKI